MLLVLTLFPAGKVLASPPAQTEPPTPTEVIDLVNALRTSHGLSALSVHTALMQVAQIEADGIASGSNGHWRPEGLTLGQWLMTLGYPLGGSIKLDGYRSENWVAADTAAEAVQAWQGDDIHTNTMLSEFRSDIGVGIAVSDATYIVLVTALRTRDGKMQQTAIPMLTEQAGKDGIIQGTVVSQFVAPVVLSTARPDGDVIHKVGPGQSLWSIAIAYQTTIDQICIWNNLGSEKIIYEGQILLIQKGATQPVPETPTLETTTTLERTVQFRRQPRLPRRRFSSQPRVRLRKLPEWCNQ